MTIEARSSPQQQLQLFSVMDKLDLKAIIAFVQKNWPAVTAAAVVLATLILMKRRKKPVAVASYPTADELPPKRQKPFYMLKDDEQDITFSRSGVASKEFCPAKTVCGLLSEVAAGSKASFPALAVERPVRGRRLPQCLFVTLAQVPSSPDSLPLEQWQTWTWKQCGRSPFPH